MASSFQNEFRVTLSPRATEIFERLARKDPALHERIENQLIKIKREPQLGKPLRHELRNRRRLHVGSFVMLYEITGNEVKVTDFDHHDKIYKRQRGTK